MKLEKWVRELLLSNDCVIVPQFGAFVSDYEPASVSGDSVSHFAPPSKRLFFNKKLVHNDGLLANHVSQAENIQYPEAAALIQRCVWDIEQALKQGSSYKFGMIGVFLPLPKGGIAFEPYKSELLLTDSFGLTEFSFRPLKSIPQVRMKKNLRMRAASQSEAIVKYGKPVLYAIPVLAFFWIMKPYFSPQVQVASLEFTREITAARKTIETERAKETAAILNTGIVTEAAASMPEHKSETLAAVVTEFDRLSNQRSALAYSEPEYIIIAGSFKDQANAMAYIAQPFIGHLPAEIIFSDGLYRVCIGRFAQREDARRRLLEIRVRNRQLKDAWVFKTD
jgi:hypothetical protein